MATSTDSFPYPTCWEDDARMQVLLSAFRARDVNPENYDAKMRFWQDLICQYCFHEGKATFSKRELQLKFTRKDRLPACLDPVFDNMVKMKRLRLRNEYEYDPLNSWTGWAMNSFVKKPLSWGWERVRSTIGMAGQQSSIEWICLDVINKFCNDLETKVLEQQAGKLYHFETFHEVTCKNVKLTKDCLFLCLHTLHSQHKIGLEYKAQKQRQIHLIKIPLKADPHNIDINKTDHAIHNLQITRTNLLKQLEALEDDIKLNEDKARQYVQDQKRQIAKTYLRKKQLLEKSHEKRSLALHNIETLLSSVDEARNNGEILDAYKIGSKALKNALNESGLKYDNVDEILSEVRDTMEQHQEMQDTISNANINDTMLNNSAFDNDELERELRNILGDSKQSSVQPFEYTPAVVVSQLPSINNNNENTHQVVITDEDLIAMLEGLEVEQDTPSGSMTTERTISEFN